MCAPVSETNLIHHKVNFFDDSNYLPGDTVGLPFF